MLHRVRCRVSVFQVEFHTLSAAANRVMNWKGDRFFKCVPLFPKDVKQQWPNSIHQQRLVLKISNIHARTLEHEGKK